MAHNRDETLSRKTDLITSFPFGEMILGGRDVSHGGTWLAYNLRNGKFSTVTNLRNLNYSLKFYMRRYLLFVITVAVISILSLFVFEVGFLTNLLVVFGSVLILRKRLVSSKVPSRGVLPLKAVGIHQKSSENEKENDEETIEDIMREVDLRDYQGVNWISIDTSFVTFLTFLSQNSFIIG